MVIAAVDAEPARADALKRWAQAYWQAIHPFNLGGAYINFMMDEGPGRIEASYGDNYGRLAQVKAEYARRPAAVDDRDEYDGAGARRYGRA